MALLNSWGDGNKVVFSDKVVTYSRARVYGQWDYTGMPGQIITYDWMWEYHRYCTKSYMYVGMDKSTANSCAEAMIAKYTREFYVSDWDSFNGVFDDNEGGEMCMADIAIQQREGHMYDVIVQVREDDTRLRRVSVTPSTLFWRENNRDYDD